ncbi:MAG: hypothetical protein GC137_02020 [Alphaproteobacteria bacterium]|nr:hypothetical protein [Alphaproteobacteria bacterium]
MGSAKLVFFHIIYWLLILMSFNNILNSETGLLNENSQLIEEVKPYLKFGLILILYINFNLEQYLKKLEKKNESP